MQTEQPIFEENMFHPSLKSNTNTIEIEQDIPGNESVDMFSSFVTAPARPGMETLIQEQNEEANTYLRMFVSTELTLFVKLLPRTLANITVNNFWTC